MYVIFIGFEYWGVFLNLILRYNKWEKIDENIIKKWGILKVLKGV